MGHGIEAERQDRDGDRRDADHHGAQRSFGASAPVVRQNEQGAERYDLRGQDQPTEEVGVHRGRHDQCVRDPPERAVTRRAHRDEKHEPAKRHEEHLKCVCARIPRIHQHDVIQHQERRSDDTDRRAPEATAGAEDDHDGETGERDRG